MEGSSQLKAFEDKAKALLLLKENLGDIFKLQKDAVIEQVLTAQLPLADAALILKKFQEIGFIDTPELAQLTTKSLSNPPIASPVTNNEQKKEEKVEKKEEIIWEGLVITENTVLSKINSDFLGKEIVEAKE